MLTHDAGVPDPREQGEVATVELHVPRDDGRRDRRGTRARQRPDRPRTGSWRPRRPGTRNCAPAIHGAPEPRESPGPSRSCAACWAIRPGGYRGRTTAPPGLRPHHGGSPRAGTARAARPASSDPPSPPARLLAHPLGTPGRETCSAHPAMPERTSARSNAPSSMSCSDERQPRSCSRDQPAPGTVRQVTVTCC